MGYEYDNPWKADDTKMWAFKVKSGVKDTVSILCKMHTKMLIDLRLNRAYLLVKMSSRMERAALLASTNPRSKPN